MTLTDGYVPEYDADYAYGRQGELLVANVLQQIATGQARIEDKRSRFPDEVLCVEVAQKPRGHKDYKPSGLKVTDSEFWVFIKPGDVFVIVPADLLRAACAAEYARGIRARDTGTRGDNPTKSYLLRLARVLAMGGQS